MISRTGRRALGVPAPGFSMPCLAQPTAPLTLESVLSAPIATGMVAGQGSGRIAWVSAEKGRRNILIAERGADGAYVTRPLTAFTQDNGFELAQVAFADSDNFVLSTGGGSLEGGGPVNATGDVAGPRAKTIHALPLGGGQPRCFGPGDMPVPAPQGDRFVFLRDGQVWIAALGSGAKARQLIDDRGIAGALAWSPDGRKLAFVSQRREGHALLGVFDFATNAITWMAPSIDRDLCPCWSPDGRRIAWIRASNTLASREMVFAPQRVGAPWSLWRGDPATGKSWAIWQADKGFGSVFKPLEDGTSLLWTSDDRLVFPWEKTGWIRLYSLGAEEGVPRPLTPDGSEVFAAAVDGAHIIYSSNAGDNDHRHLRRIAAAGGAALALTREDHIADLPVASPDGTVFALYGNDRDPLEPVAIVPGRAIAPLYRPPARMQFPGGALVAPQRVVFDSDDGLSIHGQLFLPQAPTSGKRPAVLFFHGGPQRQMLLGWNPMGAYAQLYAMNQYLASRGFVVLSVNYRGSTGYGLEFREPAEFGETGGSEVHDIVAAARFLRSRPDVDPARIGVYGVSYGGLMTALALGKAPEYFAAGVDIAGVHNWKTLLPYLTRADAAPGAAERAYQSSPISGVATWCAPVLLVNGDDDRLVNISQTAELVQALRAVGKVEPEQFVMPNELHDMLLYRNWIATLERTEEFLTRNLRAAKAGAGKP